MSQVKKLGNKFLHSENVVFQFLRSIVSSQAASWIDMGVSFVFFVWLHMMPWLSTLCGAVLGGVTNCIINYKFTFQSTATGTTWRAVAVKYILVWVGSVVLNSVGTELLYHVIEGWRWLESIGFTDNGSFAAARLLVSLIVSLAWNFVLQRNFVFRASRFDPMAQRISLVFVPNVKHHKE